jgi:multicomponent Na+:H+ antiporter subunit E
VSPRALFYFVRYLVILTLEVIKASVAVAKLVLGSSDRLRSGFVALHMDARTDLEITAFANSITLTPGTITVHVDPARHILVMHAIDIGGDAAALRQSTKEALEANILLWTRASASRRSER